MRAFLDPLILSHLKHVKASGLYCFGMFWKVKTQCAHRSKPYTWQVCTSHGNKQVNDDFRMVHLFPSRSDAYVHYCCIYGFMGLWADNIAMMNVWCGSTRYSAGSDPHLFFSNFHKYAANSSGPITNSSRAKRVQNRS